MAVSSVALTEEECYLIALIEDESGIDLAEFLWEDSTADNDEGLFRAWDFQIPWWRKSDTLMIDQCARAVGKALRATEPVLTPSGWVPIKDLSPGDMVAGGDGAFYQVKGVFPQGQRQLYRVMFSDGAWVDADADHIWVVSRYGRGYKQMTTQELRDDGLLGSRGDRKFRIPIAAPIQFPERELELDPYLLGVLLGDGGLTETGVKLSTDREIVDSLILPDGVTAVPLRSKDDWSLSARGFRRGQRHPLVGPLRDMGLWGRGSHEKFIPDEYLLASIEQRKALLAGLLDTDGEAANSPVFSTTSPALAEGVAFLARSLGGTAHISDRQTFYTYLGERRAGRPSWRVTLKLPFNPFRLGRKRRSLHRARRKVDPVRTIVSIEPVGVDDAVCIEIDSPDHTFVTKDLIVTHNTQSIILRGWAFPIQFPGFEMVVTAPELVHLNPLTSRIEDKLKSVRLTRELLPGGVGRGITHRPFQANFKNGAKIMGRIPQRDGKGVKGLHPLRLEMDEAQDYPGAGWTELIETLRHGQENAQWRAHGVSKGIGGYFHDVTQPGSGWTVTRITAMHRNTWSDEERKDKSFLYGGRDSPDYMRNILGLHGDATNPLFVLHRLMACIDDDEGSDYNQMIYYRRSINDEMLDGRDILDLIDFPGSHKDWKVTWAGMDVGLTSHPSEILVFGEETLKLKGRDPRVAVRLLTRIQLRRIAAPDQRRVIEKVMRFYRCRAFAIDRTGLGLPVYQEFQRECPDLMNNFVGYAFNEKLVVGYEDHEPHQNPKDYEIKKVAQEHAYDLLRTYVDSRRLILPFDTHLIGEWNGQTWRAERSPNERDPYGRKRFSQGSFHTLDAGGLAILAKEMDTFSKVREMRDDPEPIGVAFV